MTTLTVRFLTEADQAAIVQLRRHSYRHYYREAVDLNGLEWNFTDVHSLHVGHFEEHSLVSCLRLTLVENQSTLEKLTLLKTPATVHFPCAVLARAATDPKFAQRSLHSELRYIGLQLALHYQVQSVVGTLAESSQRLPGLMHLGYQILQRQTGWEGSFLAVNTPVLLIGLQTPQAISLAVAKLASKHQQISLAHLPLKKVLPS